MADNKDSIARSWNMSRIHAKDTKPELAVRKYLFSKGFRYRKNYSKLPGKPDIVLPKYRTVIFIHGCFWHKHNCSRFKWPQSHQEYWENKINSNVLRDLKIKNELESLGWHVIVVWECELKRALFNDQMSKLEKQILSRTKFTLTSDK